jgi:predicted porin
MYGLVDAGVGYVKTNAGNQFSLANGAMHGDRWGIKGSEDLGGGLHAIFQLENGFNVANGTSKQGGREFGRQAFVGLGSSEFGTVTLGRQYDPLVDLTQGQTADPKFGGTFGTAGDIDNYDNSMRINNSVKYKSPTFAGLDFEALYGFSGASGQPGQGQTWGAAARYSMGPAKLAAGYFYSSNASTGARRTDWTAQTSDSSFTTPINDGYRTAHSMGVARASASYAIGAALVGVSYSNIQYKRDAQSSFGSNEHFNAANIFASYQLTPAASIAAGYTFLKSGGDTSATYHQANLGVNYDLSKRTSIYALAAYQHASGEQRTTGGGIRSANASIGSFGATGGTNQELAILGMLHRF